MNISPRLQYFAERAAMSGTEAEFRAKRAGVYDPDPYGFSDPLRDVAPISPRAPHRRGRGRFLSPFGRAVLFTAAWIVVGGAAMVLISRAATFLP